MNRLGIVRVSPLSTYFVLAFVFSWALWLPVVLSVPDVSNPPWWALLLVFVGVYGPTMAAVTTAAIHGGRGELRELGSRLQRWRVGWLWYVLVLFGPPAFVWTAVGLHVLLGGSVERAGMMWPVSAGLILATFITFGPLGEELGWRGYALPLLERHLSPLASSVGLGVVWAAWHAPVFWFPPVGLPGRSISTVGVWAANVVGFSILLSYAARRTGYSVPIAILLHATLNAGPAMGLEPFVAGAAEAEEIRSWAHMVRWIVVLVVAILLTRERRSPRAVASRPSALSP